MTPYAFAVIAAGLAMGLWLDRLLPPGPRPAALLVALAGLTGLLLAVRRPATLLVALTGLAGLLLAGRRPATLLVALAGLAGLLLAGQDWAAMALGSVVGARLATALRG